MLHFDLACLEDLAVEDRMPVYASAMELLVDANLAYLRHHEDAPLVYEAGIRYDTVPEWRDIPAALRKLSGDCKTLAAWRIAELRKRGEDRARVHLVVYPRAGQNVLHAQVMRASGQIEDPSVRLGMKRVR